MGLVLTCLALFVGGTIAWYLIGFPPVTSGVVGYSLNAITRVSSQMILVFLPLPFRISLCPPLGENAIWHD